jgi:drug/metabolite transporter (DMT)-like permease
MTRVDLLLIIATVAGISLGQLLFKYSAGRLPAHPGILDWASNGYFLLALLIYGACTIVWIALLQRVELSKAYPFFALSFVLVPLLSRLFFGEPLALWFVPGALLILLGIVLVTR